MPVLPADELIMCCSPVIDGLVGNMDVREDYISSDHKPLTVVLNNLVDSCREHC